MRRSLTIILPAILISSLFACNLPEAATPGGSIRDIVATKVILTLAVFTQSAQQTTQSFSPTSEKPTNTIAIALSPPPTPTVTLTPAMTHTLSPSETPIPKPGTIAGDISGYPYGSLPKLVIVAFNQEKPGTYSYWITAAGDASYAMTSDFLLPGKYQVVAYDSTNHTGGCSVLVTVLSEQTATCDITNWGGGYPAKPSGVPGP